MTKQIKINKSNNQNGITLIALVVTMIVLIILASISISSVIGKNGLLSQSQQVFGQTKNSIDKSDEDLSNLLHYYNSTFVENIIPVVPNVVPVLGTINTPSKTINSFTLTTTATDSDGGNLTYTLYTSTTADGTWLEQSSVTAVAGNEVTLTASNLAEYATYYYYVSVTDNLDTIESSKQNSIKTYCSGQTKTCTFRDFGQTCGNCDGDGEVCGWCGNSDQDHDCSVNSNTGAVARLS